MTRIYNSLFIKGFTLVELMVTVAVLAIVAMMAVPSFTQTVRKNQLNSDTRDFINLLAETRSEAIFKQQQQILALDSSVTTFYKKWSPSSHVGKESGASSVTFNRLGQTTATTHQCFVFKHNTDAALKAYVYVQKDGIVFYDKAATACPT